MKCVKIGNRQSLPFRSICGLYISSTGEVIVEKSNRFSTNYLLAELSSVTYRELDSMCEDYMYMTDGQAMRIIDVMSKSGFLSFEDAPALQRSVMEKLTSENITIIGYIDNGYIY